jgi:ATP-dependent RNA helicase SUPV3L1/SUV3
MQRLKKASAEKGGGIYCSPLRLLAAEIYERLNKEGIHCNLMTGQERRTIPLATHLACTIEMTNIGVDYDVAVIDEIQMISDTTRGHSWTRVFLGIRANEVHLCGGLEAADIIRRLCESTGDDFTLIEYQRLSTFRYPTSITVVTFFD